MSGGVDSSVAAALLKEDGYDVIGITMQVWPPEQDSEEERFGGCCSISAVEDARRVADKLNIPYYVLNFRYIFEKEVINNFLSEYSQGRTPNPCIRCNEHIKFKALLNKAAGLEAEYIATGHYAQIKHDNPASRYLMFRGADKQKDQSYVLYMLSQEQLSKTLMPLGRKTKNQVREIAHKLGLRVADKPESQEICFIPDDNYRRFLKQSISSVIKKGPIFDLEGSQIGTHEGIVFYTIGQRKGLGIAAEQPLYVLEINKEANSITVGPLSGLSKQGLIGGNASFIAFDRLTKPINVQAQIRYNMQPLPAIIKPVHNKIELLFNEPQKAITPGQAVVFYDGDQVMGGATIESSF